ncbi:MAG: hypothetical protein ACQEQ7_12880 [Thermodesulfobacteriota bacterium]
MRWRLPVDFELTDEDILEFMDLIHRYPVRYPGHPEGAVYGYEKVERK